MHAFEGRPLDGPRADPGPVSRSCAEVRARLGIVGDRYFNQAAHRNAAVTFLSAESLEPWGVDPLVARRNVVVRGFDVDSLARGTVFSLDSGDGPVRFEVGRPAHPCAWMDQVIAPGAFKGLRGRGGVRCVPLDDGVLRTGKSILVVVSA
ncbi:MOSC domain-containing protein [Lentzea sp. NBRC 102530]|uniref:MOSC domain-containing protein n=1 Tax=Lentzea sp. NBRC 102530 TaxID=3032201 RepID=UPI0025558691|nr:MOSC domain-containing protein [Lentzea sp. NBRC 102530]